MLAWLLATASFFVGADAAAPAGSARPKTAVERHHHKGVHCMDVIERSDCAIEQFERVLQEDTRERELVTDAMIRLVRLYRKAEDAEGLKGVLRRFWDVGLRRQSRGHVPYAARFMPAELDVFFAVDIRGVREADIVKASGERTADFVFTCDEQLRHDIQMTERWRRAQRLAAERGQKPYEIIYEDMDTRRRRKEASEARRRERSKKSRRRRASAQNKEPIFSTTTCVIAKALGFDSTRSWSRLAGAASHQDFSRSMMVADIPDVDAVLARAARQGRLRAVADDHWVVKGELYADQDIHIARMDLDQILIARDDMIAPVLAAASKRRRRMNRELDKLAQQVPRDSAFYFVMTRTAMSGIGFGGMRKSTAAFVQALLPKPKGLQVAVALHDEAGVFTRVPTDNAVKGRMLVALARSLVEGQASEDPETADWVENLDIAEAGDRRAVLAAYLIDAHRLRELLWR